MSKIRLLSDHLANQIAAGEVVERPASVVKELVENSLDAGATRINVQVEGSGARLVRVVDNGEGMDDDDVLLSIERHATSKLREESRLDAIDTLGFRGEALPSIGSVSRLILQSRSKDKQTGTRAEIRYGKLHGVHEAGCAQGTLVEVHNLFGNVPVRKKFLKTARTELSHIEEVIRNQALAHVHVAFSLEVDGRSVVDLPAREELQDRFFDIFRCREYWLDIASGSDSAAGYKLEGFLLHPEASGTRGSRLRLLVNDRPVKDRMVRHAVMEGLQGFLMKGQSPGGAILLNIPADQVDVNVHPAKHEIRFRRPQDVHRFIVQSVRKALSSYQDRVRSDVFAVPARQDPGPGPRKDHPDVPAEEKQPVVSPVFSKTAPVLSRHKSREELQAAEPEPVFKNEQNYQQHTEKGVAAASADDLSGLSLVGQLFNLYLLCEKDGLFVIVDQHAAHERIIYEKLRTSYLKRDIPCQNLMFPVSVELSPRQAEEIESREQEVAMLGFSVAHFGDSTWIVKSVPALVSHVDTIELLLDTLQGLQGLQAGERPETIPPAIESLLSTMACKAAVKAGNRLAPEEILELLAKMKDTGYFSHCPHGRPVLKAFTRREIEQWFKRV